MLTRNIYPSPNTGRFSLDIIQTLVDENYIMQALKATGEVVSEQTVSLVIDISHLSAGTYTLRVFNRDELLIRKVVIQ